MLSWVQGILQVLGGISIGVTSFVPATGTSQWVMVIPEHDYFIDQGSIQREGDIVTYAGKYTVIPGYAEIWIQHEAPRRFTRNDAAYLVDKSQINCADKTMRYMQDTVYNQDGKVLAALDYESRWNPIVPGSVAEVEWDFVCFRPPTSIPEYSMGSDLESP